MATVRPSRYVSGDGTVLGDGRRDALCDCIPPPVVVPGGAEGLPLAERLRPSRLDEIVGNPRARAELRAWAEAWRGPKVPARRAALLAGPPGVGKTTAALAVASEMGWTVVEMNASDARNQSAIERVAGRASLSHTLGEYGGPRGDRRALLLLDEADCLSGRSSESSRPVRAPPPLAEFLRGRYGTVEALNTAWGLGATPKRRRFEEWAAVPRSPGNAGWARLPEARKDLDDWRASGKVEDLSDRGGLGAIARLVRTTLQPLVLTVNDERALTRNAPALRAGLARIQFYPIHDDEVAARLARIARDEGLSVGPEFLEGIVARARGDFRAALNDLDAVLSLPAGVLPRQVLGTRDRTSDFARLTEEVLTSARYYRSAEIRERLDAPPDDLLPWIEENLPHFAPDAARRDRAFAALSAADRFLVRARRERVFGLWSYAGELLTGGVGLALHDRPVRSSGTAAFPRFLGEMGQSRYARSLRDSVAAKVGARAHLSRGKARTLELPFLEGMVTPPPGARRKSGSMSVARAIVTELELTDEEVGYLLRTSADADAVRELRVPDLPGASAAPESSFGTEESPAPASGEGPSSRRKKGTQRNLGDFVVG